MPLPQSSRRSLSLAAAFALLLGACDHPKPPPPKPADDFPGTNELLRKLQEMEASVAQASPTPAQDPATQFLADLDAFPARSASLTPDEAARGWLNLLNSYFGLQRRANRDPATNLRLQTASCVIDVLPGPETWPALQHLIESGYGMQGANAGRKPFLSFFIHTLNHQETAQWADLQALNSGQNNPQQPGVPSGAQAWPGSFIDLGQKLSLVAEDKAGLEAFWNSVLDQDASPQPAGNRQMRQMELPDFVAILGQDKAAAILNRLLISPNLSIRSIQGRDSAALARSIALQNIDKLHAAPWGLTCNLDSEELYDALQKKFGAPQAQDMRNMEAVSWHVMSLILHNRADEAVTATGDMEQMYYLNRALNEAVSRGAGPQIYGFLHALLAKTPQAGFWDMYVEVAAQVGQAPQALQFVRDTAARTDLTPDARERVNSVLYKALLANDDLDKGIEGLRKEIQATRSQNKSLQDLIRLDIDLAKIGRLTGNRDWEAEGVKMAQADVALPFEQKDGAQEALAEYFMTTGDQRAAAGLEIESIVGQAKHILETGKTSSDANYLREQLNPYMSYRIRAGMILLATIYGKAERLPDIIQLLQEVPYWGMTDLLPISGNRVTLYRHSTPSIALLTAQALADAGRLDEARTVLDYDLRVDGADDAAYELFLKIGQGDLIAQLDELFRQDQFQPRPLIWKAALLLRQGKVDEAEKTCKQAIAIDPSDGHSGKGDRMRVYSVMADICDARKDTAQADFFRNVVSAIRLSEAADDYFDAGLLTRAVAIYQKALGHFSNAYCIQSRLARQLAALGKLDEAVIHYRKAFELMPDSFGRMESHCFGCERAFQGQTAEQVAEETFKSLLAKEPQKPQVHYLMGYLLKEEGRYEEALPYFRQAVELDPDYINAWNQILELGRSCHVPNDLHDKAVFNLIRLDPAGRHDRPEIDRVTDLTGLWGAMTAADKQVPPSPKSLFPLTASAQRLEDLKKKQKAALSSDRTVFFRTVSQFDMDQSARKSPQKILQENTLIQETIIRLR